jgi:hypothetical protein
MRGSAIAVALLCTIGCERPIRPQTQPAGEPTTATTKALEAGAKALQTSAPLGQMNVYLVGFHPMKDDPSHQMEAHHFCNQVNEDFAQCVLFDGNTKNANLDGIEYIISETLYQTLPAGERRYWHPHNYEILSGELVAPGIPDAAEHELMKKKVNSYGKTFHTWNSDPFGGKGDKLPLGTPMLAWSFNHDGEVAPGLVERRDRAMDVDTAKERRDRADLAKLAHPQDGVNALRRAFPHAGGAPAGVKGTDEP